MYIGIIIIDTKEPTATFAQKRLAVLVIQHTVVIKQTLWLDKFG